MSRIRRAFERRFRELLMAVGARDCEKGLRWLFLRAEEDSIANCRTVSHSLTELNIALASRMHRFRRRRGSASAPRHSLLFCDAGLGGLARWLRAAGCEAYWIQDIADADLVAKAEAMKATIITTDSFILDRRPVTHGRVRAVWVPPTLTKLEQLRLVRAELDLPEADSRCMRCGGELTPVDKLSVKDRIPPRTFVWVDDYFLCARCGQLFWHGTHWQRVTDRLRQSAARKPNSASEPCEKVQSLASAIKIDTNTR